MRTEQHPTLGILVREDGCVYLPKSRGHSARWTYGSKTNYGYLCVRLDGKRFRVHRLVLETFVGPCPEGMECDHKDRNRSNNELKNLHWATRSDNLRNTRSNDRIDSRGGTHLYEDARQYYRERNNKNREYYKERDANRRKTHKLVLFSDGKQHWVSNEQALELLKLPVKERIVDEKHLRGIK